jgi:hypothetical protein
MEIEQKQGELFAEKKIEILMLASKVCGAAQQAWVEV